MDWKDNINTIKEIYPGHFQIILDFASIAILKHLLSDDYQFVWVYNHETKNSLDWKTYNLPFLDNREYLTVNARRVQFSYSLSTKEFKELLPSLGPGITLAQVNRLPGYYLDPANIKGKTRYDLLLKECDYLFEIDIPSATDYGILVSSNRNYLQSLLDDDKINWSDLP